MRRRARQPRGGSAALALLAAAASGDGRRCPGETAGLASAQGGAPTAVRASFRNHLDAEAALLWLNARGEEELVESLAAGGEKTMNSFAGHAFRMRVGRTGHVLLEGVLAAAPALQHVEAWPCESAALADAPVLGLGDPALAGCPLATLLSEVRMMGLHVVCFTTSSSGVVDGACVFVDALRAPTCSHLLLSGESVGQVLELLATHMHRPRLPRAPEPAAFTASGRRLPDHLTLAEVGVPSRRRAMVLAEGGNWHWPPVRVGFERPLGAVVPGAPEIRLRTLSLRPRVFEVKSFIREGECDRMIEKSEPHVAKSSVVVKDADRGRPVDDWRSSSNYFLPPDGDPVLEALNERVQNLTRLPILQSEYAQILKYDCYGRYVAHHDFFDPRHYKNDKRTLELVAHGAHNRLLTVFMYMSDVDKGGETYFPAHGGESGPYDFADCAAGFSVRPERQKVIIFYNMHPNGDLDNDSLHGGCRVLNGTKWSANFWMWNVKRDYLRGQAHRRMAEKFGEWEEHRDVVEEEAVLELAARSDQADGAQQEL